MRQLTAGIPLIAVLLLSAVVMGAGVFIIAPLAGSNFFFALSIPFGFMYILIMALRPTWAIFLLLSVRSLLDILLTHTMVEVGSSDAGIGALLNLLIIFQAILLIFQNMKDMPKLFPVIRSFVIFLLICFVSIAFSPDAVKALKATMQQLAFMLIFLIPFFLVKTEKDKKFWLYVLFFSSFMPIGIADLALATHSRLFWVYTPDGGLRLQGTFPHPNVLAFYTVFVITLTFYITKTKCIRLSAPQKLLVPVYILNLLVVLIATKTRSAMLACWLVFVLYGVIKEKRYLFWMLLLTSLLFFTPQVQDRFSNVLAKSASKADQDKNSFDWRLRLWSSSMPLIAERPIFGRGLASFKLLSYSFFPSVGPQGNFAHSVYVQLLFETGVLGLLAYCGIFIQLLWLFYGRVKTRGDDLAEESAVAFAYIIGYFAVCSSDNMLGYIAFNWYLYFFLGLAAASLRIPNNKVEEAVTVND